jgi:type IV pilus assembly protein PilM
MSVLPGVSSFFGLDIGTTSVRVVELSGSGPVKNLVRYGSAPIDVKTAQSDSKADQQKLVNTVKELLSQTGITTREVAVGIPSSKVFTAVVDIDRLSPNELKKSIKYQADSLIPTPLAESKIDWAVLGSSPVDANKVELLLSSVSNDYVEKRLDMLESIGLNVIAFEPDNLALSRSMLSPDAVTPQMVVDVGSISTDLVITMNGGPRLTRSIPTGVQAIVNAAMQNLSIEKQQAEQFVFKFGLSKDKLEGQVYAAIISTVDLLMGEIEKSGKFFNARYTDTKIDNIVVTGGASALPEFPLYIANKFGTKVEIGNSWKNVAFPPQRQNELLSVSNHFGVAVGLAGRQA